MTQRPLRILKVGGSLLTFPGLQAALREQISQDPPGNTVLVPGGGPFAELIRQADQQFGLESEAVHWMAIKAMGIFAQLLHELLPEATIAGSMATLRRASAREPLVIVDPEPLLRSATEELGADLLPHDWSVTSDSISARIAEALGADELVLLKATALPGAPDWHRAAAMGYVDEYFPVAVRRVPHVRAINLRDATIKSGQNGYGPPAGNNPRMP